MGRRILDHVCRPHDFHHAGDISIIAIDLWCYDFMTTFTLQTGFAILEGGCTTLKNEVCRLFNQDEWADNDNDNDDDLSSAQHGDEECDYGSDDSNDDNNDLNNLRSA